ncbi:MAG: acyl carrier protein [Xanthomonadaceae bacterium]|nr:acyl carrier protein [Xanthomonadaceae bacterium]
MTAQEIEAKIRRYLKEEFVMDQIDYMKDTDKLTLDSLAKAELVVFMADEFGVELDSGKSPDEMFATLGSIVDAALQARSMPAESV